MQLLSKKVKGHTYYHLGKTVRKDKKVTKERLMYLGSLKGFAPEQRVLLLHRLESFLQCRYDYQSTDPQVEAAAIRYYISHYFRHLKGKRGTKGVLGGELLPAVIPDVSIDLSTLRAVDVREAGASWLCWQALSTLGIRAKLLSLGVPDKMADIILLNLVARLVYPVSENKTYDWLMEQSAVCSWLESSEAVYLSQLYQSIVVFLSHKDSIEEYMYEKISSILGSSSDLMLYDLTNTYFEGRMAGSSLARHGRSKEKRQDCRLVSIGLLCNEDGLIRKSDFYAGNVSEPDTLVQIMAQLRQYGGVMTDAGIATEANINLLASNKLQYMCVVRQDFSAYRPEFTADDAFEHLTSTGQQYTVWVKTSKHTFFIDDVKYEDNLIFVKSQAKAAKENAMYQQQRSRLEAELEALKAGLSKPRTRKNLHHILQRIGRVKEKYSSIQKAYTIEIIEKKKIVTPKKTAPKTDKTAEKPITAPYKQSDKAVQNTQVADIIWTFDPDKLAQPGEYVIRTNLPITTAKAAWQQYHTLTRLEATHRCCKTDLALRPVFHRQDVTIKGHLFLTLLASSVVHFIRQQLAKHNIHYCWKEIVRIMDTQKLVTSEFENHQNEFYMLTNWSTPKPEVKQIYDALGFKYQRSNGFFAKVVMP